MAYALKSDHFYLEALAHAHYVSGALDAAETRYREISSEKVLGWEAQDAWLLSSYCLGRVLEENGDVDGAVEAYSQFIDIWQGGDEEVVALADARARLGRLAGGR